MMDAVALVQNVRAEMQRHADMMLDAACAIIERRCHQIAALERDLAAAQARIELLDRLATAHQRGKHEAEKRIAVLTEALIIARVWVTEAYHDRSAVRDLLMIDTVLTAPDSAVDEKRKTPC